MKIASYRNVYILTLLRAQKGRADSGMLVNTDYLRIRGRVEGDMISVFRSHIAILLLQLSTTLKFCIW